jgi:hypothetical protein
MVFPLGRITRDVQIEHVQTYRNDPPAPGKERKAENHSITGVAGGSSLPH